LFFKRKLTLNLLFFVLIIIIAGLVYEQFSRAWALKEFQPQGILVDIGERKIHLDCRGYGSPVIVFESGLDTQGSLSWSAVHNELAKTTRACSYDRAGIMWSDPRPPTTNLMSAVAKDLDSVLISAGEKPPYVLVGHSFGGPYITKFTELYGHKVAGIVFIDAPHPEIMALVNDLNNTLIFDIAKKFITLLKTFYNVTGITRILSAFDDATFPNQPKEHANAVKAFASISNDILDREISNYKNGLAQVSLLRDFGDRPMFVIWNIVNYPSMSDEQLNSAGLNRALVPAVMAQDLYMFNDQSSWSSDSQLTLLHNTSHYVQFDKPAEVINAVEIVVEKVKKRLE
jgi:pimeloyl-ACP methyl ester carboxylesterase